MLIGWGVVPSELVRRVPDLVGTSVALLETIVLKLLLLLSTDQMGPVMLNGIMFKNAINNGLHVGVCGETLG